MKRIEQAHITLISAGAGSGKTHRLSQLLHAELSSGRTRPAGVIATTFTNRAAAELRERTRGYLLAHGDFARANAIGEARIGTVNSVCHQLLQRFSFEAGIAPEQRVLDDAQARALLARAVDSVLGSAAMGELLAVARRLGLEESWNADLLALVRETRANDIDAARLPEFARRNADDLLGHFPPPVAHDLSDELLETIEHTMPVLENAAHQSTVKKTAEYMSQLRAVRRALTQQALSWGEWCRLAKAEPEARLRPATSGITAVAVRVTAHAGLHADIRDYLERGSIQSARPKPPATSSRPVLIPSESGKHSEKGDGDGPDPHAS